MNAQLIIFVGILYLIGALMFFKAISYRCVMAIYGEYDFTFMNLLIALVFPISIIAILIKAFIDDRKLQKDPTGEFEKFKKKILKEYGVEQKSTQLKGGKEKKNGIQTIKKR